MKTQLSDLGLFGPESMAWKIHGHPSGWVGGIRALLLQALEPRAMAGVVEFSQFSEHTWERFNNTSEFIMTVTYRSKEEARAAIAHVRKVHEPIVGIDPYTGRPFHANDPYLLAYIHNCLVDSLLCAYTTLVDRLDDERKDQYVAEMTEVARLFGADMAEVPSTADLLAIWLSHQSGLIVTPEVRQAAEAVKTINIAPQVRPLWLIAWNAAVSIMPPFARRLYGFEMNEVEKLLQLKAASFISKGLRAVLPHHPYYREAKSAYYEEYSRHTRHEEKEFLRRFFGGTGA